MAKYDVYVQGQFYKTVDAPYTNNALTQITLDIQDGLVPHYNPSAPSANIELRPASKSSPSSAPSSSST